MTTPTQEERKAWAQRHQLIMDTSAGILRCIICSEFWPCAVVQLVVALDAAEQRCIRSHYDADGNFIHRSACLTDVCTCGCELCQSIQRETRLRENIEAIEGLAGDDAQLTRDNTRVAVLAVCRAALAEPRP